MLGKHIAVLLAGLMFPLLAASQDTLRIGVSDSDGPPINVISRDALRSGLTLDIGTLLARELNVKADFVVVSRKRVESSLEAGRVDIICNANPVWYDDATKFQWTHELYPQIERVATRLAQADITKTSDLSGMRIATIHGYSYPTLENMWSTGQASRTSEERLDLMMKALTDHLADAAIVTELEFVFWAKSSPAIARQIKIHPMVFTSVPTMCALSPLSPFTLAQLNRAIDQLQQTGRLKATLSAYQWHPD